MDSNFQFRANATPCVLRYESDRSSAVSSEQLRANLTKRCITGGRRKGRGLRWTHELLRARPDRAPLASLCARRNRRVSRPCGGRSSPQFRRRRPRRRHGPLSLLPGALRVYVASAVVVLLGAALPRSRSRTRSSIPRTTHRTTSRTTWRDAAPPGSSRQPLGISNSGVAQRHQVIPELTLPFLPGQTEHGADHWQTVSLPGPHDFHIEFGRPGVPR
jgi:hypothetical protein